MTGCDSELPYDFYSHRSLVVRFSDMKLSSVAGILLARQAEKKVQVCRLCCKNFLRSEKLLGQEFFYATTPAYLVDEEDPFFSGSFLYSNKIVLFSPYS